MTVMRRMKSDRAEHCQDERIDDLLVPTSDKGFQDDLGMLNLGHRRTSEEKEEEGPTTA